MPRYIKRRLLIVFYLLCLIVPPGSIGSYAAEKLTAGQWQELTSDKAFNYKDDKENVKPVVQNSEPGFIWKAIEAIVKFIYYARYVLWVLLIAVLLYIIYRIFLANGSVMFGKDKKKLAEHGQSTDNIEDIATTNWEALLQQAIARKDLRLAVRYRYMWLLQLLQRNELIHYRTDKTNYEYYLELKQANYKQPFRQLSRQYEYAWYGQFELSDVAYNEYSELFSDLKKQLNA